MSSSHLEGLMLSPTGSYMGECRRNRLFSVSELSDIEEFFWVAQMSPLSSTEYEEREELPLAVPLTFPEQCERRRESAIAHRYVMNII